MSTPAVPDRAAQQEETIQQTLEEAVKHLRAFTDDHNLRGEAFGAPFIGVSVLQDEPRRIKVVLWNGPQREDFRLTLHRDRPILTGRGGSFNLQYSTDLALVLATVKPSRPGVPEDTLNLQTRLEERGFTVSSGEADRFDMDDVVRLIVATHPDGTVLWFTLRTSNHAQQDLDHGLVHLAAFAYPFGFADLHRMALEDHELAQLGSQDRAVPEQVMPRRWTVSGDALDRIIHHARSRLDVLDPDTVPFTVPRDFSTRDPSLYRVPELAYTRAQAQQARRDREANLLALRTLPLPDDGTDDLPF